MTRLSTDYEIECHMLEKNSDGLHRAEIEHVARDRYKMLPRWQQDSKAISASKGSVTMDRGKGKKGRPHPIFDGKRFIIGMWI